MFSTPNFRGKKAAIVWMLCLALALVLVDYYAGPVNASKGWQYEVLWSRLDKITSLQYQPQLGLLVYPEQTDKKQTILVYNPEKSSKKQLSSDKISKNNKTFITNSDKVKLMDDSWVKLTSSERQGQIVWHKNSQSLTVVRRLHSPRALIKDNYDNLYLIEQGRSRILKISHE